jgi:hypothetical protein
MLTCGFSYSVTSRPASPASTASVNANPTLGSAGRSVVSTSARPLPLHRSVGAALSVPILLLPPTVEAVTTSALRVRPVSVKFVSAQRALGCARQLRVVASRLSRRLIQRSDPSSQPPRPSQSSMSPVLLSTRPRTVEPVATHAVQTNLVSRGIVCAQTPARPCVATNAWISALRPEPVERVTSSVPMVNNASTDPANVPLARSFAVPLPRVPTSPRSRTVAIAATCALLQAKHVYSGLIKRAAASVLVPSRSAGRPTPALGHVPI